MSRAGLAAAGRWIDEVRRRLAAKDLEGLCDRDPPEPVLARKSRACDVWRRDDVGTAEERVVWPRRFGIEDVEPGRTDMAGIECLDECGLIYEPAAGGVDEDGSGFISASRSRSIIRAVSSVRGVWSETASARRSRVSRSPTSSAGIPSATTGSTYGSKAITDIPMAPANLSDAPADLTESDEA